MKKFKYIIAILSSLTLFACERPADVEVPNSDPKPVVFAFLSPEDSVIKVSVTLSNPIFTTKPQDNNIKVVADARVTIENEEGKKVPLNFNFFSTGYTINQSEFKIEPGKKYKVNVSFEKYNVYGETTIPNNPININTIEAIEMGKDEFDNVKYAFYTRWIDEPMQSNYYRVVVESKSAWGQWDTMYNYMYDAMQSDLSNDGKELFIRTELYYYEGMLGQKNYLDVNLLNTDYHYYEYHKRRLNYFGDDPFSEPIPMYTNIKGGGLGVVGSYRKVVKEYAIGK